VSTLEPKARFVQSTWVWLYWPRRLLAGARSRIFSQRLICVTNPDYELAQYHESTAYN